MLVISSAALRHKKKKYLDLAKHENILFQRGMPLPHSKHANTLKRSSS